MEEHVVYYIKQKPSQNLVYKFPYLEEASNSISMLCDESPLAQTDYIKEFSGERGLVVVIFIIITDSWKSLKTGRMTTQSPSSKKEADVIVETATRFLFSS